MEFNFVTISSWQELVARQRPFALYRGQADSGWTLSTSLERACLLNDGHLQSAKFREERLLLTFKRHYHDYSLDTPQHDDELRWLAIMQHHGAPTRLLDWTYSILVAAYFALENASSNSVIWEIDAKWIVSAANEFLRKNGVDESSLAVHLGRVSPELAMQRFKETYLVNTNCFVRIMSPYYRDARLTAQQGMFTCPGNVSIPFMDNLQNMAGCFENVTKLLIPFEVRKRMLYQLYSANIGRFSLFPGLDGFASTLRIFHPIAWDMNTSDDSGASQ